jgi:hypothetical protein
MQDANLNELVGQVVVKLMQLPAEDLPLVIEFVDYLAAQQRQPISREAKLSIAEIRAEAHRRAKKLSQISRTEIVARFQQLTEEIRQTAIAKNTAVEGDWLGD